MQLHIEPTTRCIIACPACPRTVWYDITKQPVKKEELDVVALEKFLDCATGKEIDEFVLCGDYGDPIYYPDLFKLISRFRDRVSFTIITNGSGQKDSFWNTLSTLMTTKDTIIFSIDGQENTNHLYRVNSNWNSIMTGLDIMVKSPAQVHWKTIIFKFNHDKLAEIKKFAISKGATWHAEKTHRHGNDDLVPPTDYVQVNHVFRDEFTNSQQIEIEPRCEKDAKVITASGYFHPCDWIRNPRTFYKSQLWKQKDRWLEKLKIDKITYDQGILIVRDLENYFKLN